MMRLPNRAQRGETLIEAMISLAIMSVGLLGILQMNALASQQSGIARRETIAATIARDLVDAFERLPYDHAALSVSTSALDATFVDPSNANGLHRLTDVEAGRPLLGAAGAILGSDVETGAIEVMWRAREVGSSKRIAVMVVFPGANGRDKQLTLWTAKADLAAVLGGDRSIIPEI